MNKFLFCFLSFLSFLSFTAYGQEEPKTTEVWAPPTPVFSQKFDWLKLKSGEWLKGEIISMYDDELEFESDEFDTIFFDWEDVTELRSRFDQQIRFANGDVKQGFLIVKDDHLVLISGGAEQHFPLSELLSITSSGENRKDLWTGKISLGLDVTSGNTNELDYLIKANIQRRTPYTRLRADLDIDYSKSTLSNQDDQKDIISDSRRFTTTLDWFYTAKVFFRVMDYERFRDLAQNIESRDTLGVSIGYHLVQSKRTQWDVTVGPSYQNTVYYNAEEGNNQKSGVIAFSTLFEYSFSSRVDYLLDYQLQFVDENSGKRNSHLKTGFEFEFTKKLELDITLNFDRIAEPVSPEGEIAPEPNDYRLVVSFGYKF